MYEIIFYRVPLGVYTSTYELADDLLREVGLDLKCLMNIVTQRIYDNSSSVRDMQVLEPRKLYGVSNGKVRFGGTEADKYSLGSNCP